MTKERFASELRQLRRREALLTQAQEGSIKLRRILVTRQTMKWTVNAKMKSYYRDIAPKGWKAAS